jgi:enoyl-CoA hydratase/carnithine racemase
MTGRRFSSGEALDWGFVNHVVADAGLLPEARKLAAQLLEKDPLSLALTKSTVNALAEAMVPASVTHADPDYLMLASRAAAERRDAAGSP